MYTEIIDVFTSPDAVNDSANNSLLTVRVLLLNPINILPAIVPLGGFILFSNASTLIDKLTYVSLPNKSSVFIVNTGLPYYPLIE